MMDERVDPQASTRVGGLLRAGRLRAGLDIAEVARYLNIRRSFLQAIEDDRSELLPAPVCAVGFVRAYAVLVGLDAQDVVRSYRDEIVELGVRTPLHFPLPVVEGSTPKGGMVLLGALIAILAYGGWYASSSRSPEVAELVSPVPEQLIMAGDGAPVAPAGAVDREQATLEPWPREPSSEATAASVGGKASTRTERLPPGVPSPNNDGDAAARVRDAGGGGPSRPAEMLALAPPAAAPTLAPRAPEPLPPSGGTPSTALAAEPPDGGMPFVAEPASRIALRAKTDSWIEIREGQTNTVLSARLLKAGDVFRVPDRPGLRLLTGNAGGLVVTIDGELAPALGRDGVVRRGVPLDADVFRRGLDIGGGQ